MKFVRVGVLTSALLFASICLATADKKPTGFNVGGCSPESFAGAHLEVLDGESITLTAVSQRPGEVTKLKEPVVYKYTNTDKDGKHYASARDKSVELIVFKEDEKVILGELASNGEASAIVFGKSGNEDSLAADSEENFKACLDLIHADDPQPDKAEN